MVVPCFFFFCVALTFDILFVGSRSWDGEKGICGIKKDWKVDSGLVGQSFEASGMTGQL